MRTLRSRSDKSESTCNSASSSVDTRGRMQTITPEEPGKLEYELDAASAAGNNNVRSRSQSMALLSDELQTEYDVLQDTEHSLRNTRLLELDIAKAVSDLETIEPRTEDTVRIIALLNRSLSAISHWSLQAQLSHWENRKEKDERFAVEKNLVKKEAEYFKNKLLESEKLQKQTQSQLDLSSETSKLVSSAPITGGSPATEATLLSPRRVVKQRKIASPRRNNTRAHTPVSTLKLVENTKPHPRLKRNLNDQTNQDLIRVFHLEKVR